MTFDQRVDEALSRLPELDADFDVVCEHSTSEELETKTIGEFMAMGCGCQRNNGQQCSQQFTSDYVREARLSCMELSRGELDMAILGQVMAARNVSATVVTESRHLPTTRELQRTSYRHQGKAVCASMFRFLHTVGKRDSLLRVGKITVHH